jgi:hypothetical protein
MDFAAKEGRKIQSLIRLGSNVIRSSRKKGMGGLSLLQPGSGDKNFRLLLFSVLKIRVLGLVIISW